VWVRLVPGALGQYKHSLRACELDERFVWPKHRRGSDCRHVVHEATTRDCGAVGIGYAENIRVVLSGLPFGASLPFARKLPNGEIAYERAKDAFGYSSRHLDRYG